MSFQNNDSSDFDFSIIDKKPPEQAKLNFSVQSLLSEHNQIHNDPNQSQTQNRNTQPIINNLQYDEQQFNINANNGSFLQDLEKLEHQLSFQTQLYNVYHQETQIINSNSLNPINKSYLYAKSNSHLKTTKQESNNQHTLQSDDYGYLVLDFTNKRKKSSKLYETQKLSSHKHMYTQQGVGTSSSQKLKLSSSSGALTENISISTTTGKIKHKNSSLNKLLSPKLIKNRQKSNSKDKDLIKLFKSKSKDTKKLLKNTLQKTAKVLSKPKSIHKNLNNTKKANVSTTIAETSAKTNKSYTKSTRQANAYSQYYGFEDMGDSQRLVMKSNCLHSSASEKNIISPGKRSPTYFFKKSASKSKCKKSFHSPSPSSKDLTMRFKKKKLKQHN